MPDEDIEEGWAAFAELKEQGLVRHIGVSNFDGAIAVAWTLRDPAIDGAIVGFRSW
jgi:aryl-alcohol dehydrogenase-like predicted oxidoreductase